MKKIIVIIGILVLVIAAFTYIQVASSHIDEGYYRKLAWEAVNHDKTVIDHEKAQVSLININKFPVNTPPVFSSKLNRRLLVLNGGRAVRVEFTTTMNGLLGPIVLYFNPFTKKCFGGDLRL